MAKFDRNWWRRRQAKAYAYRAYDKVIGRDRTWYHGGENRWKRYYKKGRRMYNSRGNYKSKFNKYRR